MILKWSTKIFAIVGIKKWNKLNKSCQQNVFWLIHSVRHGGWWRRCERAKSSSSFHQLIAPRLTDSVCELISFSKAYLLINDAFAIFNEFIILMYIFIFSRKCMFSFILYCKVRHIQSSHSHIATIIWAPRVYWR